MAHKFWFSFRVKNGTTHNRFYFHSGLPRAQTSMFRDTTFSFYSSFLSTSTLSAGPKTRYSSITVCEWHSGNLLPDTYTKLGISEENCTNMRRPLTIARPNSSYTYRNGEHAFRTQHECFIPCFMSFWSAPYGSLLPGHRLQ